MPIIEYVGLFALAALTGALITLLFWFVIVPVAEAVGESAHARSHRRLVKMLDEASQERIKKLNAPPS